MSQIEDNWPLPAYPTAPKESLHALGVITLNFNNFEFGLFRLFSHHFERKRMGIETAWRIYSALQDVKKPPAIKDVFSLHESDPLVVEHVGHIIDFFNRCHTNRNHLFHSTHDHSGDDMLRLRAGVKGRWESTNTIELSLVRLRQVADDMFVGWNYLIDVWVYLQRRDNLLTVPGFLLGLMPEALPQKPLLPDTLNPSQTPRTAGGSNSQLPEFEE